MLTPTDPPHGGTECTTTAAIAFRRRAHVSWRPLAAAALLAVTLGVALAGVFAKGHATVAPTVPHKGLASLPLAAQGQISATLGASQHAYRVSRTAGGFAASNPAQRMHARFGRSGAMVSSGTSTFGLSLRAVGYGNSPTPVETVAPTAETNRVSYAHPGITEWYANGPLGVEHGFTISRPLSGRQAGPLTLSMALSGNARVALTSDRQSLRLSHAGGTSLRYGGLTATDARGRTLHSWLALQHANLLLTVDTRGARYPVRIDPWLQQGPKLTAGEAFNYFGISVALSAEATQH